ncbi:hypothetical protein EHQ53_00425 [Leptospira langatensis]|uniref:Tetratricopeptide repeat protein n=1 Tax=Leptospira langatensis TaxID=2484983 RepID=A0A5F2A0L2_9LEPT|nr:hypothetical protein EHO57_16570 [Leptospira langatensis]TGL43797.1 hypothetical protein EHQ53_00425 [Leptospira langatensis]
MGTSGCTSVSVPGGGRFGSELIQEQAILDFYGSEEERNSSLQLLRSTCRSLRKDRGLACYNLSVLYDSLGDSAAAWDYAVRAKNSDPKDPLYGELAFSASLKMEGQNGTLPDSEEALYKEALDSCKKGKKEEANASVSKLVELGSVSKESLSKGIFAECGLDPSLLARAKSNSIKPSLEYYKSLEKDHPYKKVWDLSGEFGRTPKEPISANKATQSWRELKKALGSKDQASAKRHLISFKEGLDLLAKENAQSSALASNLKKAAFLLLSEDSNYSAFKELAKELDAGNSRSAQVAKP